MITRSKSAAGAMNSVKTIIAIALVLATLCTITAVAAGTDSYYVELDDGKTRTTVYTTGSTAQEVLEQANVNVSALDKIDLSGFTPGENSSIRIDRSCLVGVNDKLGTVYFTFDGTVAQAIELANVNVGENDVVNYSRDSKVTDGMVISVAHAFPITVSYHGKRIKLEMAVGTVADALEKAGITPGESDIVSHKGSEVLTSGMVIFVDEVVYKEYTEKEVIPFEKTTKKSAKYSSNVKTVTTKGVDGEKTVTYKQKYVNGVLVDTAVKSEKITKKPVTQVTTIGVGKTHTLKANGTPYSDLGTVALDSNGIPTKYSKVISGSSTAYIGGTSTASGRPTRVGHVAVNPKIIPYGTRLYIVATDGTVYGYAIAADTGGFIHDGKTVVDVYMASYDDACQWGRKDVNIYVLD